ncbi:hypothetical protein [Streptomyces sp. NBC_00503]|uniref:hypothetical protein n=1 Tax=Streptomyces sp. NBC_00503 TaxID=2903659 RepID=UPI002E824A08|nr:hypothetical protein [Streptomyces sp. NBC_00503]WUD81899.1 hypothetical protein OG490_15885 [Streptomyces sp. NBC_00503]
MPGQRKRKRSRERAHRRTANTPGRWEPLFSTGDHAELKAHVRRLHAEGVVTDLELLRIDMFCGRLVAPTTYQVSLFVPDPSETSA